MRRLGSRLARAAFVTAVVGGLVSPAGPAQADTGSQSFSGTLADGATWVADVPANWNGTMILYSHGYSSMVAQNAPNAATKKDLLAAGYAMVGSSYSGPSLWALSSAVDDQFGSLEAIGKIVGEPRRTIAWGQSMGGLVSALEAQKGHGRIDGTLTTCGLVAGALNLNNYQLAGEYAASRLLSSQPIKLVNFKNADEAGATVAALNQVTTDAQKTAQGRARVALAAALVNMPTWYTGAAAPGPREYEA